MNTAIILAGGKGLRVGADIPKQFIKVLGKPIMIYTLETFQKCDLIDNIVLVCVKSHLELAQQYCEEYNINKVSAFVEGGVEFIDFCTNGMNSLVDTCNDEDIVLITSADRPFISCEEIEDSIEVCKKNGCGIAARPCSLCMFKVGEDRDRSSEYMRNDLMQTATPWTFSYGRLKAAIDMYISNQLPECESYPVAIYVAAGNQVFFSKAKTENIKITQPFDIALMEQMIKEKRGI